MKEFIQVLRRFVPPYKKFLGLSILFNVLSAVLNIFSFAALIPILQIIFKTGEAQQAAGYMAWDWNNVQTVAMNNMNYYVSGLIDDYGQTATLLMIGMFLAVTTLLKTGCYFLTSAMIVPLRTGIVRDKLGRKMSKSLGNSPDPLDLIERYGADGVRMGILLSAPAGNDILYDDSLCEQGRNFCNKIWNCFRMIDGLDYGSCGPKAEGAVGTGAADVERHHVAGGGNAGRTAHHKGVLCRGQDEPTLRQHQFQL